MVVWFTSSVYQRERSILVMFQWVVSTLGSVTSRCCTAKCADNSLLHSTIVANTMLHLICSTKNPFDLRCESVMYVVCTCIVDCMYYVFCRLYLDCMSHAFSFIVYTCVACCNFMYFGMEEWLCQECQSLN